MRCCLLLTVILILAWLVEPALDSLLAISVVYVLQKELVQSVKMVGRNNVAVIWNLDGSKR